MHISSVKILSHRLNFKFEAGTSRGTLKHKDSWFIQLFEDNKLLGVGEAGPLQGLSIESIEEMPEVLESLKAQLIGKQIPDNLTDILTLVDELSNEKFPSIKFALETALLDAMNGGKKVIFPGAFTKSAKRIPINGLVWMGDKAFMAKQIEEKLNAGFNCIKMKIGAIDFKTEIALLSSIRASFPEEQITLRVDANGAFSDNDAMTKLEALSKLGIHSIEQPIKAGQAERMAYLCEKSPLAIALDEELIGVNGKLEKEALLRKIKPQYIIIKPSLLGGIGSTLEWVAIANKLNISWWMTSMLESNIGLNAICQLSDYLAVSLPQGLGTGQLYHNNIDSPLSIEEGHIYYDQEKEWAEIP